MIDVPGGDLAATVGQELVIYVHPDHLACYDDRIRQGAV